MPSESTPTPSFAQSLAESLRELDPSHAEYAVRFVDRLLTAARSAQATDLHLQPTSDGLAVRWRIDGVLQQLGVFPAGESADVVSRLKVQAGLLTYRLEVPQEGRIQDASAAGELRVSTFPTLYGERAVVRLFADQQQFQWLNDIGFDSDTLRRLTSTIAETSGVIVICGPAGSGKTTTAYACLRDIVRHSAGGMNVMSLEDPIEVVVEGVSQSQVNESAGFGLEVGLKSMLRQDPEVMMVGEIRDRTTAEQVFQAALTGHLVITTFHAGSAAEAVHRLAEMDIEPYQLRSGLLAIICQRLVRTLCRCATSVSDENLFLGIPAAEVRVAQGCDQCLHTGYRGRMVLAETLDVEPDEVAQAILERRPARSIAQLGRQHGMVSLWERACDAVREGRTSPQEIRRVFGFRPSQEATLD